MASASEWQDPKSCRSTIGEVEEQYVDSKPRVEGWPSTPRDGTAATRGFLPEAHLDSGTDGVSSRGSWLWALQLFGVSAFGMPRRFGAGGSGSTVSGSASSAGSPDSAGSESPSAACSSGSAFSAGSAGSARPGG